MKKNILNLLALLNFSTSVFYASSLEKDLTTEQGKNKLSPAAFAQGVINNAETAHKPTPIKQPSSVRFLGGKNRSISLARPQGRGLQAEPVARVLQDFAEESRSAAAMPTSSLNTVELDDTVSKSAHSTGTPELILPLQDTGNKLEENTNASDTSEFFRRRHLKDRKRETRPKFTPEPERNCSTTPAAAIGTGNETKVSQPVGTPQRFSVSLEAVQKTKEKMATKKPVAASSSTKPIENKPMTELEKKLALRRAAADKSNK
jgi:hypothetical protein